MKSPHYTHATESMRCSCLSLLAPHSYLPTHPNFTSHEDNLNILEHVLIILQRLGRLRIYTVMFTRRYLCLVENPDRPPKEPLSLLDIEYRLPQTPALCLCGLEARFLM
jgi:hypothetical protein